MKKLINYASVILIMIAFLISAPAISQEWSKDQQAVWKSVESSWEGWKKGDANAAFGTLHDEYLGWNENDPMPRSKAKWMKQYETYKDNMTVNYYDIEPVRIAVEDNSAAVFYYFKYSYTWSKDGKKKDIKEEGRNVEFYVKDGGKWMLLGDMTAVEDDDD